MPIETDLFACTVGFFEAGLGANSVLANPFSQAVNVLGTDVGLIALAAKAGLKPGAVCIDEAIGELNAVSVGAGETVGTSRGCTARGFAPSILTNAYIAAVQVLPAVGGFGTGAGVTFTGLKTRALSVYIALAELRRRHTVARLADISTFAIVVSSAWRCAQT
jgi:hypothetical protein